MAKVIEGLYYSESHEFVRLEGNFGFIGITDYAQNALGNVVYVDMPDVDDEVSAGEEFGAVESVKAASDLISPVSGTVVEVNEALEDTPELINEDAFENWIIKVELSDASELDNLMDAQAYAAFSEKYFLKNSRSMAYKYFPQTEEDLKAMMEKAGVENLGDLYAQIPESIRFQGDYNIPEGMSEIEIRRVFEKLGSQNKQLTCYAGYGVYDHYSPSVIPSLLSRSEFLTSYTPYQAEISQGTLHYIFEYQSMMAELTGMDISNASMYDGTTATAEAMMMAVAAGKKQNKVLVSETLNKRTRKVLDTYALHQGIELVTIEEKNGVTDSDDLKARLAEGGVAGVIVQQPNAVGIVEDFTGFAEACHENKALFIMNSVAVDLAVLKTPGEWGADIAVGDGQSLGIPMQFGGPYVGYMCCTEKLIRKMPGRNVGMTKDNRGQRAFVLTLQAREQHIRRQKATSNICSNQSLMALWVTVYMSLMGKQGLKEAAELSYAGAHYFCDKLLASGHFSLVYDQPFFNEFLVRYDGDMDTLFSFYEMNGILPGVRMTDGSLLIAVTEKRTKDEIDHFLNLLPLVNGVH